MPELTIQKGTSFVIGDDVTVTVVAIKGKGVILGTEAPKDIPVHREELYQRINGHDWSVRKYVATKAVLRLLTNKLHNGIK